MKNQIDLPESFVFHHIGYATSSIQMELKTFNVLGYDAEGEVFVDQKQGIRGIFLTGPGPRIELLENLPNSETLSPWLSSGIKMYHFAYLVDEIEVTLDWARANHAKVTVRPTPAVAFGGRLISFVIFRNSFLLEFIEK